MKFHEFNDFTSHSQNTESEIERLRKAQAEIKRIKKRRVALLIAAVLTPTSIAALLLINHGNHPTQQSQPRNGS